MTDKEIKYGNAFREQNRRATQKKRSHSRKYMRIAKKTMNYSRPMKVSWKLYQWKLD